MNRTEALRILGLDDDATPEDVKTAYKETVQILHPDRFASNITDFQSQIAPASTSPDL